MARPEIDIVANMDDAETKRRVMSSIGSMKGLYKVQVAPKRDTRSTRANAYYWAVVVRPFFELLRDQEPCVTESLQAHVELKRNVLGTKPVVVGGITCRIVKTTHDMTTAEFYDYVDRARAFLYEKVGIVTPDPGEIGMQYRETPTMLINEATGELLE